MGDRLRRTGNDLIGDVPWGTHFCQFYKTKEDLLDVLVPYFKAGLEDHEFCMWVTSEPLSATEAQKAMQAAVPDFDRYLKSGQIEILRYTEWYVRDGSFDSQKVLQGWVDKVNEALERGYEGLRLTGNTFWLEKKDWRKFTDYEQEVDSVIGQYRMMALCTYSLEKCGASEIIDVIRNHEFALINREGNWEIIEGSERKKAEQEYAAIIRTAMDGFWITDAQGRFLDVNEAYCSLIGYSRDELLTMRISDVEAKEAAEETRLHLQRIRETGSDRFETRHRRKDGRIVDLEVSVNYEYGGNGRLFVFLRDITERKEMEKSLEHLASFPELNPNPVVEVDFSTAAVPYMNPAAKRLFPALPQSGYAHPFLADLKSLTPDPREQELIREVRADSAWYEQYIYYLKRGASARIYGFNVSERKKAEQALRRSNERLGLLSETASRLLLSDAPQNIVNDLCQRVMDYLNCQVFFNFLVDPQKKCLHLNAYSGIPEEAAREIEWLDYGVAVCGCAARDHCRIVAEDIFHVPDPRTVLVKSYGVQAYACHPLFSQGEVIGTLSFGTRTQTKFTEDELALMKTVADQVAVAMERMRYIEELQAVQGQLRRSHEELEKRVEERTASLFNLNRELKKEISVREQAEKELQAASLYARNLIEVSLDPLVTISADGKIMDVNQATERATGISRGNLIGSDFSDYFTEPEKARGGYKEVFSQGFVRDYPLAIRHTSGRITHVLYNATVYKNEAGDVQGVFAAARDITERKKAEDALQKAHDELEIRVEERTAQLAAANRELESFSYSVAHDLRAPLRAIDGFSRMFLEDYGKNLDPEGHRLLSVVRSNTIKMGQLIDDLLTFSRLGRQEFKMALVDMRYLAETVFREVQANSPEHGVQFRPGNLLPAHGDPNLLRQVLGNLLSNAFKFTRPKENATIEMASRAEGREIIYSVKDNGVGFDQKYVGKLFGVFQRLHSSDQFEGTGVGLAIVERIIQRHGGRVWAEGRLGEGATFYFSLPRK